MISVVADHLCYVKRRQTYSFVSSYSLKCWTKLATEYWSLCHSDHEVAYRWVLFTVMKLRDIGAASVAAIQVGLVQVVQCTRAHEPQGGGHQRHQNYNVQESLK